MKNRLLAVLKIVIGWPVTLIAVLFIIRLVVINSSAVWQAIQTGNLLLLLTGIALFIGYFLIRVAFWQLLLRRKNHILPYKQTAYLWEISEIRRYVPGNILALVTRTTIFTQLGITKRTIINSLWLEAVFLIAAGFFISMMTLPFVIDSLLPTFPQQAVINGSLTAIISIACILFLASKRVITCLPVKYQKMVVHVLPDFSFRQNTELFILSCIALLCFGGGTYATISAFALLPLQYLLMLMSFFVFSLMVSYLSFLTPMGLGVREAVLTAGLSQFMQASLAGFGAIAARFFLIIAEVIFFFIVLKWNQDYKKKNILDKFYKTA